MRKEGFSLLELTISIAILSIVGALAFVAIATSASSVALARAKADVVDDARGVLQEMTRELQLAAKQPNVALVPPLNALQITENPVAASPIEIVFQTPLDGSRRNWSTPITYRYINEDLNNNFRLDAGEDTDGDGALSRRVVRIQDGQARSVAAANHLSDVRFARNGNVILITVSAADRPGNARQAPVLATVQKRVYLLN